MDAHAAGRPVPGLEALDALAPGEVCGALAVRHRTRRERSGIREDFATIADVGSEAVGPPRSAPAARTPPWTRSVWSLIS
jgi:hypothetical protein